MPWLAKAYSHPAKFHFRKQDAAQRDHRAKTWSRSPRSLRGTGKKISNFITRLKQRHSCSEVVVNGRPTMTPTCFKRTTTRQTRASARASTKHEKSRPPFPVFVFVLTNALVLLLRLPLGAELETRGPHFGVVHLYSGGPRCCRLFPPPPQGRIGDEPQRLLVAISFPAAHFGKNATWQ